MVTREIKIYAMKRICVVGCGRWGSNHLRTLFGMGWLAAAVETSADRLRQVAEQYPGIVLHNGIDEAARACYDGYVVATPAETHFTLASYLLSQNCNVLVEKPMTLDPADAAALVRLAADHGKTLMVGHLLLFHPAIRKIKELTEQGAIGRLQYLYSTRLNLGTVRTMENVFQSFAPHDIAVLEYLVGAPAMDITAQGARILQPGICDTVLAELTYPGGIRAHIHASWLHPFKEQRLVIVGETGMMAFDDASDKQIRLYHRHIVFRDGRPVVEEGPEEVVPYDRSRMPLEEELRYFADHPDGTATVADGRSGCGTVLVLDRVQRLLEQSA